MNIYQPAQGAATSVLAISNFQNPVSFICGAVRAASRLGAEQSAKLCTQYLAPIVREPAVQLPAAWAEPVHRRPGPAERDHLQRGLAAARLHSAGRRQPAGRPGGACSGRTAGLPLPAEAPAPVSGPLPAVVAKPPIRPTVCRHDGADGRRVMSTVGRAPPWAAWSHCQSRRCRRAASGAGSTPLNSAGHPGSRTGCSRFSAVSRRRQPRPATRGCASTT